MKCLSCDNEFQSKRSTAKYCSAKCRKLAFYKVSVPDAKKNAKAVTEPQGVMVLPDCVPLSVRNGYAKNEPDYVKNINQLITNSLTHLTTEGVWIPVWRYNAGENAS